MITPSIPDAYASFLPKPIGDMRPSVERQRRMRADVLATTRRMLATDGHDSIKVARIAESCGVTVQTLHNSFGCRSSLLTSALNQHTEAMDCFARSMSNDPLMFLHLAEAYCQVAANQPDFLRNMLLMAFSKRQPLLATLQGYGIQFKIAMLRDMAARALLRDSIDLRVLSRQIARLNTFASYEWAAIHDDIEVFRREIIDGNGLLLLGALVPAAAERVEAQLVELLAPRPAPSIFNNQSSSTRH